MAFSIRNWAADSEKCWCVSRRIHLEQLFQGIYTSLVKITRCFIQSAVLMKNLVMLQSPSTCTHGLITFTIIWFERFGSQLIRDILFVQKTIQIASAMAHMYHGIT